MSKYNRNFAHNILTFAIDETLLLANTGEYISIPYNAPIATAQLSNIETIV